MAQQKVDDYQKQIIQLGQTICKDMELEVDEALYLMYIMEQAGQLAFDALANGKAAEARELMKPKC